MKGQAINRLIGSFRRTLEANHSDDGELLKRYREQRDLDAFEALVRKHGSLVLSACRRVLVSEADVEDAFQATFLVLMNDPGRVRKVKSLGSWLYGVGHRISLQIYANKRRRERLEKQSARRKTTPTTGDVSWHEACIILHEELDALPDKYREVLMLCYLEGKSRDEVATDLGLTLNEVRGALERGRERLRKRLEKRGVTLSVGLLAAVGNSVTAGVPPTHLIQRALGQSSSTVTELARGAFPMMSHLPLKLGTAVLLLAGVFGLGLQFSGLHAGPAKKDEPPAAREEPKPAPKEAPKEEDKNETVPFAGTVVDAAGKPVAGAKIYLIYYTSQRSKIPERATTDADGKYQFTVKKGDFNTDYNKQPWQGVSTVAVSAGQGLGWTNSNPAKIQMAERGELTGRLVNLEGRPLEGVTVQVVGLQKPQKSKDLADWVKELNRTQLGLPSERNHLTGFDGIWIGADLGQLIPPAVSGKDGRFRLPYVGKERLVELQVSGPGVETRKLKAMTREAAQVVANEWQRDDQMMPGRKLFYIGNNFDLALNHGRTVTGMVKEAKSGKPIANAKVYEYHLANDPPNHAPVPRRPVTTDVEGKFTMHGLPIKGSNSLVASAPKGQTFLLQTKSVVQPEGFGPATVDFDLAEGIMVSVKAIDKITRKPVKGIPSYFALAKNEYVQQTKSLAFPQPEFFEVIGDSDSFKFVVPPGPGLISFRSNNPGRDNPKEYMMGLGVEAFTDSLRNAGSRELIDTRPYFVQPANYNNLIRIEPKVEQKTLNVTVELDIGQSVKGKIIAPEGTKLTGKFIAQNLKPSVVIGGEETTLTNTEFTVTGLREGSPRTVVVRVPEQKLTGKVRVAAKQENIEVKLVPWATLRGRAVDADGKPYANMRLGFMQNLDEPDPGLLGSMTENITTDVNGFFKIEGLTPGLKYRIAVLGYGRVLLNIANGETFKEGEERDLGEVRQKMNP